MSKIIYRVVSLIAIVLFIGNTAAAQKKQNFDTSADQYIVWGPIKPGDVLWKKRIWRRIDLHDPNNTKLHNELRDYGDNIFANILLRGINTGVFKAYAPEDSAFIVPLTPEQIAVRTACHPHDMSLKARINFRAMKHINDSVQVYVMDMKSDSDTGYIDPCHYPQQVEYYELAEDWIFDRNKGEMVVHIVSVTPIAWADGNMKKLFTVQYPDIRSYMAHYYVYNGKNKTDMSWDQYFESRQFSSKITAVEGGVDEVIYDKQKHKRKRPEHMNFDKDIEKWSH